MRRRCLSLVLLVSAVVAVAVALPGVSSAQTGASLTGTIQDASTSADLSGASVAVLDNEQIVETTRTAANGTYSFSGLQPNLDYQVTASESGYVENSAYVNVGALSASLNLAVSPALYSGTITDHTSGDALDQAQVLLVDAGGEVDEAFTDANGYYAFPQTDYSSGATYHVELTGSVGDYGAAYSLAYYSSGSATGSSTESGGTGLSPASASSDKTGVNIAGTAIEGVIAGTITDGDGAVSGGRVTATQTADSGDAYYTYASSTGTYVIPALSTGSYLVDAYPPSAVSDQSEYYNGAGDPFAATPVSVTSPAVVSPINIKLPAGATVAGTVTNPSGSGIPDVTVDVKTATGNTVASATTDGGSSAGDYFINGLPAGTYYLFFNASNGDNTNQVNYLSQWYGATGGAANAQQESEATAISVSSGGGATVNQSLSTGGEITGTITDAGTGDGLSANVTFDSVSAGAANDEVNANDETGKFTLYGVQPGSYDGFIRASGDEYLYDDTATSTDEYFNDAWAWFNGSGLADSQQNAGAVTVSANAVTTLSAALPTAADIQGTVSSNGEPVPGVDVNPYDGSDNDLYHLVNNGQSGAETASDGTYEISHLLPGAYKVGFSPINGDDPDGSADLAFQFYNDQSTLADAATMSLTAGQNLTGINATLGSGGEISGTVTDAASGSPLASVGVYLLDGSGNVLENTQTHADGTYTLISVPTGSYYIEFDATGTADQTQFYGPSQVLAGASAVSVTAGQTTSGINAALSAATTPGQTSTVSTTVTTTPTPPPTTTTPKPVVAKPTVAAVKLAGIATHQVTLSFTLTQGKNAAKLKSVRVTLPRGFAFLAGHLAKDLKLSAKATAKLSQGVLIITLKAAEPSLAVSFKNGAISVTRAVATAAKRKKLAAVKLSLLITSSAGVKTTLLQTIRKPG